MSQASTQSNILSGFRNSGTHPLNSEIFDDEDSSCSSVTDTELTVEQSSTSCTPALPYIQGIVTETTEENRDASESSIHKFPRSPAQSTSTANEHMSAMSQTASTSKIDRNVSSGTKIPPTFTAEVHASTRLLVPSTSTVDGQDTPVSLITPEMIKPFTEAAPTTWSKPGKTKIYKKTPEKIMKIPK
ncbi:hypothetical protein JTB14_022794 [Gonioctena quinquepunctata]|nr:hypothetical protein JTB14_022794 [Gonioctena quinquepunctata]